MQKRNYILKSVNGLSSRLSCNLVSFANRFNSLIILHYDGEESNLKSIMNVMALVIQNNERFAISCSGDDEDEAINSIDNYLKALDIIA